MMNKCNFLLPKQNQNKINKNQNQNQNQNQQIISIIVKSNFFILNEINIYEIIKNISNNQKHFYIFDSYQPVNYSEIDIQEYQEYQDQDQDQDANIFNNVNVNKQETDLILLNYKDKTLFSLFEYIHMQSLKDLQKIKIILDSFSYLLDSIQLLIENNLVHNNINQDTVYFINNLSIITSPSQILLKFDHSIVISKNSKINLFPYLLDYNPKDIYLPLEFQLLSYLKFNNLTSLSHNHIENIINVYNCNQFNNETLKEESYNYLNTFVNKSIETIMNEVSVFYYTWDTYKLSIYFLEILLQLDLKCKTDSNSNIILENFTELLIKNINPNPLKRSKLQEIKNNIQELLP